MSDVIKISIYWEIFEEKCDASAVWHLEVSYLKILNIKTTYWMHLHLHFSFSRCFYPKRRTYETDTTQAGI